MKKILILLLISTNLYSQDYVPDRPGICNSPYLVGLHQIDFESGIGYNYYAPDNVFYNTYLFRYGMFKHLEIRGDIDFGFTHSINNTNYSGVKAITLGVKIPIINNIKYLPDVGLMGGIMLPNINKAYTPIDYLPAITLLLSKNIKNITIASNVGIFWDGHDNSEDFFIINPYSIDNSAQFSYSIMIGYSIKKLQFFVETYGFMSNSKPYSGCDGGISYFLTPELQMDFSIGLNYIIGLNNSFIGAGIAWRIPNKNK